MPNSLKTEIVIFPQSELERYIEEALDWFKEQLKNETFALPSGTLEKAAEAITDVIIPVIDSIPTDVVINQEAVAPVETAPPIQIELCPTCQNRKLEMGCKGCDDGRMHYVQERVETIP